MCRNQRDSNYQLNWSVEFEWDPAKAAENLRKHKVSFKEAATVFGDFLGDTASDPDHSADEHRYITVASSNRAAC
jgi:uncharacterized DUF497 family protein